MSKKYEIAAASEAIYEILLPVEGCRRNWQFALYYAILNSTAEGIEIPTWKRKGELYRGKVWNHTSQWNYDHEFRNNLKSKRNSEITCSISNISWSGADTLIFNILMQFHSGIDDRNWSNNFILSRGNFGTLWQPDYNGKQILYEDEVTIILNSISEYSDIDKEEDIQEVNPKFRTLFNLIPGLRKVYQNYNEDEKVSKDYIETIIGAALFYLPHPVNECFNGYCSLQALNNRIRKKKTVKEHVFPRKKAGNDILHKDFQSLKTFINDFQQTYSEFMYLTADENSDTVNFEGNHDDALKDNSIDKFPLGTPSPFFHNHKRFLSFIRYCRNERGISDKDITLSEASELLNSFLNND